MSLNTFSFPRYRRKSSIAACLISAAECFLLRATTSINFSISYCALFISKAWETDCLGKVICCRRRLRRVRHSCGDFQLLSIRLIPKFLHLLGLIVRCVLRLFVPGFDRVEHFLRKWQLGQKVCSIRLICPGNGRVNKLKKLALNF